jgi:uncharacterized LabA/DUF88 family protein
MPSRSDKLALFIDGANLYATVKALGFDSDYKRLLGEFQGWGTMVRAHYYTAIIEDQEYSSIRPLIDWLDYNGYTVVTKPPREFIDATGRRRVKGNMDVELAVHAMELVQHIDHLVLFSGDGDFQPLVQAVQRRGVRVTVVSTIASRPPMVADELRRQADDFVDIIVLQPFISRLQRNLTIDKIAPCDENDAVFPIRTTFACGKSRKLQIDTSGDRAASRGYRAYEMNGGDPARSVVRRKATVSRTS